MEKKVRKLIFKVKKINVMILLCNLPDLLQSNMEQLLQRKTAD